MIALRAYQLAKVEALRAAMRAGKRRIVSVDPTGGGKTVIATYIIESALGRGKRILFLAHRRELVRQSFTKLLRMGLPPESIGVVMAGVPARAAQLFGESPLAVIARLQALGWSDGAIDHELWSLFGARRAQAPIQVGSVDTAKGRDLGAFDLVIVDECHRAQAPSYIRLIQRHVGATILGLTATPFPTQGKSLGDPLLEGGAPLFEALVPPSMTARQLADTCMTCGQMARAYETCGACGNPWTGYLVAPRMYGVPPSSLPDLSAVRVGKAGDYVEEDLERAADTSKLIGDAVDHWGRRAQGLRSVGFAAGRRHSRNVVDAFRAAGVRAEHLDGETPREERDAILMRLDSGETQYVSNVDVLTTGWDQPRVACLQFMRPTKSRIYAKQMMGRGLRPHPEKPFVLFLDHAAVIANHGGPLDEEDYELTPSRKKRRTAPAVKTCPSCFGYITAGTRVCPLELPDGSICGHVFAETAEREDPEQEDGELVEIPDATRDEKRAYFDQLCTERGSRPKAWVAAQFFERFKVRAPASWKVPLRPEERDENKPDVVAFWRTTYRDGWARGYKPGWAARRFKEEYGRWPSKALRDEREAWIEAQTAPECLEEQLRASVREAPPVVPLPGPAPELPMIEPIDLELWSV